MFPSIIQALSLQVYFMNDTGRVWIGLVSAQSADSLLHNALEKTF